MELAISGRNTHIPRWLEDYIEKKVGKLDRYLPSLDEGRVDVREENTRAQSQHYVVQVTLYDKKGKMLRGEERGADIRSAVDLVVDKMHHQILRFKTKRLDRYQRGGGDEYWGEEMAIEAEEDEDDTGTATVVRTKRFAVSPMNTEEAVEQMDLLGHTFFVYYDADTGQIQVVYRRHDGNYGVLIPELT
jgi:putative sigma-54 modulation protein